MAKKTKEYHRLPGNKKGFLIGKYTLWQGTDHLLHVFSRFGVEDYKRFYFSDLQAIMTRKTIMGKIQNIVIGCFLLFFALPAIISDGGKSVFLGILAGVMLIFLFINLLTGPTCTTRVITAVQTEKLPSLHRLKNTLKVMDRLRPFIENAQGPLISEDPAQRPSRYNEDKLSAAAGEKK